MGPSDWMTGVAIIKRVCKESFGRLEWDEKGA